MIPRRAGRPFEKTTRNITPVKTLRLLTSPHERAAAPQHRFGVLAPEVGRVGLECRRRRGSRSRPRVAQRDPQLASLVCPGHAPTAQPEYVVSAHIGADFRQGRQIAPPGYRAREAAKRLA
jgi:hypothetical protein